MDFFRAFTQIVGALTDAHHFERLGRLSDRDFTRRGLDRDRLVRSYLAGLGAK